MHALAENLGLDFPDLFLNAIDHSFPVTSSIQESLAEHSPGMRQLLLSDSAFCRCIIEITDAAIDEGVRQMHKGDHLAAHQRILMAGKLRALNDVPEEEVPMLTTWLRMREGENVRASGLGNTKSKIRAYLAKTTQADVQAATKERLNNILQSYVNPP